MAAFCPVCQVSMVSLADACPHVAVVAGCKALMFEGGRQVDVLTWDCLERTDLDVLTDIGDIEGAGRVYFSPNPSIYIEALKQSALTGVPAGEIYVAIFRALGMEHDAWHEGRV